ncbi:MAG: GAF domain-containing protein [Anaerolineales bacterium]|nr:MAG: GAF domain-containing protein [Anaerolineales bacterium]
MTERTKASLDLLYSISRELTEQLDLRELLQRVLQLTLEAVRAPAGSILVLDEYGEVTEGAIAYGGKVHDHSAEQLRDTYEQGLAGWVVENRQAVLVQDTSKDKRWLHKPDEKTDGAPRSVISVPLLAREHIVGALTLARRKPNGFTEEDLALATAIADQAGVAVSNAHLFRAEQERRRFASTLQEIARTISSTLDPNSVFEQVLEQLRRVIEYDSASIFLVNDDHLQPVAAFGFTDIKEVLNHSLRIDEGGLGVEVFKAGKIMVVTDVQQESAWVESGSLQASGMIRGWIGAPLIVRDRVVGVLNVDSHRVGAYGLKDAELVSAFADQAATAVANAQLYGEIQRRVQSMTALTETARSVTASLDLDEVLQRITERTMDSLEVEAASLALLDEKTDELEFRVASGRGAEQIVGLRLMKGQGLAGWVVEHKEAVFVSDVQSDPRFYSKVDELIGYTTRVMASVPIQVQDKIIGVIEAINPRGDALAPEQIELLRGIADLAGTAIVRAQLFKETQAARQRYASLFEDSIDTILITDLAGEITDANNRAETILGLPRNELLGLDISNLHMIDKDFLSTDLSELSLGETVSYDSQVINEQGEYLPVEVHVKRIDIGTVSFLQWILRDVTERLELAKLRSDLTSMIFHDLRSPLGNIISSLEVLRESLVGDDETIQSVLSIASRSSRRASRLVESLLDLDRLETDQAVLNKSEASIGALIAEAVEEVHPTAEAKGQLLRMELAPGLPMVLMDVDMVRRVLINLLENAIKFSRGGDLIQISVRQEGDHLQIAVKDSGVGISQRDRERIFEKFTRLGGQERPKGLGLGLAFCRLAVEAHEGRIWVESEEGKGSTFAFTLPV